MQLSDDAWIGQSIDDRYVVRRFIGRGGMGAVYEAEQTSIGRRVALKLMLASDAAHAERLKREAKHASQVVHEHVAQVYDHGHTADGRPYLAMEYIDGVDLAHVLRDEVALPVERAVTITRQILEGLAAIHALGIVHRDVKPSNVLLTTRGDERDFVKLGDFGLARARDDATLTRTGHIVGTTPFMAPEVFRGEAIDHRADLYAVGITLYQMLAGKLPFLGATAEIGALHVWAPPPPLTELRSDLPAWIVRVVERALAKAPADRYSDAQQMIDALDRRGDSDELPTAVERPRPAPMSAPPRRWPWVLLALAVVGGGALGAYLAQSASAPAQVTPIDAAVRDVVAVPVDAAVDAAVDTSVLVDAGEPAPPPDASGAVASRPDASVAPVPAVTGSRRLRDRCACLPTTGGSTPLCARQRKPLCRCMAGKGEAPLCLGTLVPCTMSDAGEMEQQGLRYFDVCGTQRCSDTAFLRYARPGVHGEACTGTTVWVGNHNYRQVPEGEVKRGTWECDTCPGADNQTYHGVEGDPCTGYHWRTGEPVAGTLRHCD